MRNVFFTILHGLIKMDLVKFFFELQQNIKLYHWNTASYARHVASDTLGTGLAANIDKFMEILQGKKDKRVGSSKPTSITLTSMNDEQISAYLRQAIEYLQTITMRGTVSDNDTDLLNIRDDMVGQINQTLYLFSFH
jgi:hypothetical protein